MKYAVTALIVCAIVGISAFFLMRGSGDSSIRPFSDHVKLPARPSPPPKLDSRIATEPAASIPPDVQEKLSQEDSKNVSKILQAFKAPIEFYGKVVDQNGRAVPDAKVYYSAADQYFGSTTKYESASDQKGLFSIDNIKGAGLYVNVAKEGYYGTKQSGAGFGYGVPSGKQPPSKERPAIFVLQKKGEAEPLIRIDRRQFKVPKDGVAFELDLTTGSQVPAGQGQLRFERWEDAEQDSAGRFDWKCSVTVPGGGLALRSDELAFEAPETGYQKSFMVEMPKAMGSEWKRSKELDCFVRLANGSYGRIKITMYAGHSNFLVLESYLNPRTDSRNLEFDANKSVSSK